MPSRKALLAAGLVVAIGGGTYVVRDHVFLVPRHADAAPAMPPMPVPVAHVSIEPLPIYLDYPARVEAIREVTLQAKTSGFLQNQAATDGADVKEGDLLYRIDPADIEARLDQARAQLEKDEASLTYLQSNYDRGQQLARSGYIAKDTFDQRESAVKQAEATLAMDRATVHAAELNLADTEIRAPFAGRLGRNRAAPGTFINPGATALNTLVQIAPIYVTFNPTDVDLARIEEQRAHHDVDVEVTAPGSSGGIQRGKLVFIDNALDRTTGTVTARAVIDNDGARLLPGQYVRIRVAVGQIENAKLVPQVAIGSSQLGKFVYAIGKGNLVEQHLVSLGPTRGEQVAVLDGLSGQEQIITGNLQKIGPGMPVQPAQQAEQHAP